MRRKRRLWPIVPGLLWAFLVWGFAQTVMDFGVTGKVGNYAFVPWVATLLLIAIRHHRGAKLTEMDKDLVRYGYPFYWILLNIINGIMAANAPY